MSPYRAVLSATLLASLALLCEQAFLWFARTDAVWQHLASTVLREVTLQTAILVLGVVAGTILLGVSLAGLTALCRFPGRDWLDSALILPMAVPPYVMAFVALGLLDFFGPVHTALRQWLSITLPPIRSVGGLIGVMTLAFYPYVYVMARNAFLTHGRGRLEQAQSLGQSAWQSFFSLMLPLARPAMIGGGTLVMMETLSDFGTVSLFNYDTYTTAIYKAWFGLFSMRTAIKMSLLLACVSLVAMYIGNKFAIAPRYDQADGEESPKIKLTGIKRWAATSYALIVLCISVGVPMIQLGVWTLRSLAEEGTTLRLGVVSRSVLLGMIAALSTGMMALTVVYGQRRNRPMMFLARAANLGYALPGAVLAVGMVAVWIWIRRILEPAMPFVEGGSETFQIGGTLVMMLLAYGMRFFAVAYRPIESAMQRVPSLMEEAGRSLGAGRFLLLRHLYWPALKGGAGAAGVLIFLDVMKEMPLTLMMRPFGWDTLSVRIFEKTAIGQWEQAALPALILMLIGGLSVIFVDRSTSSRKRPSP